jgi:hypothetical protein
MTADERDEMKAQLEQALAIADAHDLVLTGARIAEALAALASEAGRNGTA